MKKLREDCLRELYRETAKRMTATGPPIGITSGREGVAYGPVEALTDKGSAALALRFIKRVGRIIIMHKHAAYWIKNVATRKQLKRFDASDWFK